MRKKNAVQVMMINRKLLVGEEDEVWKVRERT